MTRRDEKLSCIRAGRYTRRDFIIADAKDGDMGPSLTATGPKRERDGSWTRYRTRAEILDSIRAVVAQDLVDIMLVSASNLEVLVERFRADAQECGFRYFLEVFNPNVACGIDAELVPHFINDSILRCLAGPTRAERPEFLKIAYNGPRALEELASFDPGVLGGGGGTTRDTFELLHQAEQDGARVALFGRKINLADSPLAIIRLMREVADGTVKPDEAVRAYHGELARDGITPSRALEDDIQVTEAALKHA